MEKELFQCLMELCRKKKFDEARQKYKDFEVIKKNGNDLSARHMSWLAKIEGLSGNIVAEIDILENLLKFFPNYYSAHFMIARARIKLHRYEKSIKSGQAVLSFEIASIEKPFSRAAAYLIAYSAMKLCDRETFELFIHQVDDDHAEWLEGRLWSKQNLIDEVKRTFSQN